MVNKFSKNNLSKKRGISTIVGGMIFLVLLTAGFSTFFLAMDVQSDTINAQLSVSDSVIDKTQEQFEIAVATDDSNNYQLGIQVKNKGSNPVEISDIWIINKSQANQPAKKIAVDYSDAFIPPGYGSSILEKQTLYMIPNDYDIKVISTLGTIKKAELNVGGNNYLLAEMFTIPPDVRLFENVTVALRVTNVGPTTITGIAPDNNPPINDNPPWVASSEFVSVSPVDLEPSESTIFSWHTTLTGAGTIGEKLKFTNLASGIESTTGFSVSSNTASDKIVVRQDDGGGEGDLIVLTQDLLARPEIFLITPSSFGKSPGAEGVWATNIVNPTNATMEVSKVTFSAVVPGANNNDQFFHFQAGNCDHDAIYPNVDSEWNCPTENQLVWKDVLNTEKISPFSVKTFAVGVEPDGSGNSPLEGVLIQSSVFTTMGAFGKSGYESSKNDSSEPIVNVYLSDNTQSRDYDDINGTRKGIPSGNTEFFNIVLADMDNDVSTRINSALPDTRLVINVPKGWGLPSIVSNDGFDPTITINKWADNSSQIMATLASPIGDGATDDDNTATIRFSSVAPTVGNDQLYVMYVLADGATDSGWNIGPLAEIVLQVKAAP
jgi:archaellum component FlaF (FlaF/FlaG flagellin family)